MLKINIFETKPPLIRAYQMILVWRDDIPTDGSGTYRVFLVEFHSADIRGWVMAVHPGCQLAFVGRHFAGRKIAINPRAPGSFTLDSRERVSVTYPIDALFVANRQTFLEILYFCPCCGAINEIVGPHDLRVLKCRECKAVNDASGARLELSTRDSRSQG